MDTLLVLAFCEVARIGYLCVRRKCIASALRYHTTEQVRPTETSLRHTIPAFLTDSQLSKIKRVLSLARSDSLRDRDSATD